MGSSTSFYQETSALTKPLQTITSIVAISRHHLVCSYKIFHQYHIEFYSIFSIFSPTKSYLSIMSHKKGSERLDGSMLPSHIDCMLPPTFQQEARVAQLVRACGFYGATASQVNRKAGGSRPPSGDFFFGFFFFFFIFIFKPFNQPTLPSCLLFY